MPLRSLVLLHVVHQDFQAAVLSAVIEVETEAAKLERFAAAFVLAGVDAGVELLEHLVVAREQGAIEHLGIAQIQGRLGGLGGDHDAGSLRGNLFEPQVEAGYPARSDAGLPHGRSEARRLNRQIVSAGRSGESGTRPARRWWCRRPRRPMTPAAARPPRRARLLRKGPTPGPKRRFRRNRAARPPGTARKFAGCVARLQK